MTQNSNLCLWFYQIKYLINNQFDNIDVAITNNCQNINLDIININHKTLKSATFILLSVSNFFNPVKY